MLFWAIHRLSRSLLSSTVALDSTRSGGHPLEMPLPSPHSVPTFIFIHTLSLFELSPFNFQLVLKRTNNQDHKIALRKAALSYPSTWSFPSFEYCRTRLYEIRRSSSVYGRSIRFFFHNGFFKSSSRRFLNWLAQNA
jgi:hypothetical protein